MDILTQDEADTLGVIEKYLIEPESVLIPPPQKTCIHYIRYRKDGQYYDNSRPDGWICQRGVCQELCVKKFSRLHHSAS